MSDQCDISDDLTGNSETFTIQNAVTVDDPHMTIVPSNVDQLDGGLSRDNGGAEHYFIATSQGLFPTEQLPDGTHALRNCIVIQDQASLGNIGTNNSNRPASIQNTPINGTAQLVHRTKNVYKHNWDDSVSNPVLSVRCKDQNGELHKSKFGSGSKGRCIKSNGRWFTPSEWENHCGRATSKDWKRSIRYAGRIIGCLVEDNILQPHACSCTCAVCCDDEEAGGPVRYFTPYRKRRSVEKRKNSSILKPSLRILPPNSVKRSKRDLINNPTESTTDSMNVKNMNESVTSTFHVKDCHGNLVVTELTHIQHEENQIPPEVLSITDLTERNIFSNLYKTAEALEQQVQNLKELIRQSAHQIQEVRGSTLKQYEKDKMEAVSAAKQICQMSVTRALSNLNDKTLLSGDDDGDSNWKSSDNLNSMVSGVNEVNTDS